MYNEGFTSQQHKNYVEGEKNNMVAMVTVIAIYLHFTRKKHYIGIEKAIFHEFFYCIYHLKGHNLPNRKF